MKTKKKQMMDCFTKGASRGADAVVQVAAAEEAEAAGEPDCSHIEDAIEAAEAVRDDYNAVIQSLQEDLEACQGGGETSASV